MSDWLQEFFEAVSTARVLDASGRKVDRVAVDGPPGKTSQAMASAWLDCDADEVYPFIAIGRPLPIRADGVVIAHLTVRDIKRHGDRSFELAGVLRRPPLTPGVVPPRKATVTMNGVEIEVEKVTVCEPSGRVIFEVASDRVERIEYPVESEPLSIEGARAARRQGRAAEREAGVMMDDEPNALEARMNEAHQILDAAGINRRAPFPEVRDRSLAERVVALVREREWLDQRLRALEEQVRAHKRECGSHWPTRTGAQARDTNGTQPDLADDENTNDSERPRQESNL